VDLPRAWTAFGGASLALMGVALAAGARRHAADNLAWRRQWNREMGVPAADLGDGSLLILVCRAGGTLGILLGLGFIAAAASGRALSSVRFGGGDGRALGACFALLGAAFTAIKVSRGSFGERAPGEKIADAATWTLCALWIAFGVRLISETLR
jgi:hypothetical protein